MSIKAQVGLKITNVKMYFICFCVWIMTIVFSYANSTSTLTLPTSANCGDQAALMCTSTTSSCDDYKFIREDVTIYNQAGPTTGTDQARYSATVTSANQVQLTITNIQLSDAVAYTCSCGFDVTSARQTLRYECKAVSSTAAITANKKLRITMDRLYPQPSTIVTSLINPTSQLPGTYTCGSSPTLASHYTCTWNSTASLPDGNHGYTIAVTTLTEASPASGSFMIVTPTSPTISNLSTIFNNRQVVLGAQDMPLTIQCVSSGGIPAPTLAWYKGSTSTSPLAQSTTSDSVQQPDGTYTVTLIHTFIPGRRDDMTPFLCRVFYPGATTGASSDPSPASALLYLDLKPDMPTVSQAGEAASGRNMTLRCSSANGRPAPSITWSYFGQTLTPTNTSIINPTPETYTVVSVLQRPVSAVDNGQTATCRVFHTLLSVPLQSVINVDVKFGPTPGTVAISGNKTTSATGAILLRLNCTSGSSNPASNITWYYGSEVIPNTEGYTRWPGNNNGVITSNILTITPTRYMDGDRVTCRTDNGYGSDSTYVSLDVLSIPIIFVTCCEVSIAVYVFFVLVILDLTVVKIKCSHILIGEHKRQKENKKNGKPKDNDGQNGCIGTEEDRIRKLKLVWGIIIAAAVIFIAVSVWFIVMQATVEDCKEMKKSKCNVHIGLLTFEVVGFVLGVGFVIYLFYNYRASPDYPTCDQCDGVEKPPSSGGDRPTAAVKPTAEINPDPRKQRSVLKPVVKPKSGDTGQRHPDDSLPHRQQPALSPDERHGSDLSSVSRKDVKLDPIPPIRKNISTTEFHMDNPKSERSNIKVSSRGLSAVFDQEYDQLPSNRLAPLDHTIPVESNRRKKKKKKTKTNTDNVKFDNDYD